MSIMSSHGIVKAGSDVGAEWPDGCGEKDHKARARPQPYHKEDVKKEAKEAYEIGHNIQGRKGCPTTSIKGAKDVISRTQEQMKAFRELMETRLVEYKKEIDQLQAKAESLGGDAKAKAEQQLAALRQKQDEVSGKLKELGSSSGKAWEQIKSGLEAAMDDLGNAYKKVAAEFSKS